MRRLCWLLPAFMLAVSAAADVETVLTEDEFLDLLGGDHPAVVALSGDLGAAEGRRRQSGRLRNPSFDFEREQPDDLPTETVWQIAWAPPLDGQRRWSVREADAAIEAERSELAAAHGRMRLDLRRSYAEWTHWHLRSSILDDHAGRLDSLAQRMRSRADSGEESLLDARRLEIAADSSRAALSEARAQTTLARADAEAWILAARPESPGDLSLLRPDLPELPQAPDAVDPALHPELVAAASRLEQAEAGEKLSRQVFTAPELRLGWKTVEAVDQEFDGLVFGLGWDIPLFDRRQGDRLAAESALAAARAESDWTAQRARAELTAARSAYVELRESALAARLSIAGLDDISRSATAAYEHGETSVTDLLDTLGAVRDARIAALDLYLAALTAYRQLEYSAGLSLYPGGLS